MFLRYVRLCAKKSLARLGKSQCPGSQCTGLQLEIQGKGLYIGIMENKMEANILVYGAILRQYWGYLNLRAVSFHFISFPFEASLLRTRSFVA